MYLVRPVNNVTLNTYFDNVDSAMQYASNEYYHTLDPQKVVNTVTGQEIIFNMGAWFGKLDA